LRALAIAALVALVVVSAADADIYMSVPRGSPNRTVGADVAVKHPTGSNSPVSRVDSKGRCHGPSGKVAPASKCSEKLGGHDRRR
jgi:hypothetical protein